MKSRSPIIPAVLTTSPEVFGQHLAFAKEVGNSFHIDVIDNEFCPGKTLNIDLWPELDIEYSEAHLMVKQPQKYLEVLAEHKITRAIVHIESDFEVVELADTARRFDVLLGFAVNIDTDLDKLRNFYAASNYIQLMGIHPGRTHQPILDTIYSSVAYLSHNPMRRLIVTVDGGVSAETAPKLRDAGADYLVSTSAIFERGNTWKENYEALEGVARI